MNRLGEHIQRIFWLLKSPKEDTNEDTNRESQREGIRHFTFCTYWIFLSGFLSSLPCSKSINYLFPKKIYTWIYFLSQLVVRVQQLFYWENRAAQSKCSMENAYVSSDPPLRYIIHPERTADPLLASVLI